MQSPGIWPGHAFPLITVNRGTSATCARNSAEISERAAAEFVPVRRHSSRVSRHVHRRDGRAARCSNRSTPLLVVSLCFLKNVIVQAYDSSFTFDNIINVYHIYGTHFNDTEILQGGMKTRGLSGDFHKH